jgi:alpha-glucosidase
MVTPKLADLPVYVRGGTILPLAPLTQSTAEIPNGPLTLRVYPLAPGLNTPGEACAGEVYTDDGHSFNFRQGDFARIHFTCAVAPDGSLLVEAAKQEGRYKPWWHEYRIEAVGWTPTQKTATVDNKSTPLTQTQGRWGITIPANPKGLHIKLQ